MSTVLEASEGKTNGTRLARLLVDGGTHALRAFFDSIHPPRTLQVVLSINRSTLKILKSRRAIFDSQWEALYPPSGDPPDSKTFDITLLHLLLREICFFVAPATGWNDLPYDGDLSSEAHIVRIKFFRNELCHSISTSISDAEFNDKWNKISKSLVALGFDQNEINRLKTEPIDHCTEDRVKAEVQEWNLDFETQIQGLKQEVKQMKDKMDRMQESPSGKTTDGLESCLPDEVPIFGRSKEIRMVTEAVQTERVAVAVITGGPGFGKTTVANKVAHELVANQRYRNTVLFCPIRSKTTVFDVATSMILACSKNHSQPPENPQHWLLNWSKQRTAENVTFVLDNADDVLQSDQRTQFTSILRDMRILSGKKVTFVVTSRRVFKDSSLKMTEVRLKPLSLEESMKILVSRLPDQSLHNELFKTEKLVELCGCVPLALCIVGSLLSDYTEGELIKSLEEKPLDVLREDESDDNSVEKAIKTSFDVLSKTEQEALILMSAFPGSFSSEAAKAVITNCTDCSTQAISLLRSLKNRSLVEQPASNRYEIHPLIQAFLKKMDEDTRIVDRGRRAACSYFISRLDGNADLYWSKDNCKKSIELFNKDRHNFEYFIKACISGLSDNDRDVVAIMETLLEKYSPISSIYRYLYLEKILLPTVYVEFLEVSCELLTSSKQAASKTVMLLCLLGHQNRNAGGLTKYKDYVLKATDVHSQNPLEFDNDKLAEAFFQNNIARCFSEEGKLDETKEQYDFCLEICKEHPSVDGMPIQKAITLFFAGAEHNRRNERHEAEEQFNEALDIYQEVLGEHVMTASVYRGLGDFYLFHGEKSLGSAEDQQKSIKLYEKAIDMFGNLGMGETKECILSLTNLGICRQLQGELQEAMKLFEESWNIAERELQDDHKWKIYVKTQIAYLYKVMGNIEEATVHKNEAMQMSDRLGLPDNQPKNKFLLHKI